MSVQSPLPATSIRPVSGELWAISRRCPSHEQVPAGKATPSKNPAGSYHHILGLDVSSQVGAWEWPLGSASFLEAPVSDRHGACADALVAIEYQSV